MVSFSKPQAMAVASKAVNYWKSLANTRGYATSTAPKTRSVASAVDEDLLATRRTSKPRGDYVPVYVALGLIVLSTSFGLYTAKQQLAYAPNVLVDKKKRETIPEVVDPDWAISEAERFISKSIFRKVAHLQDFDAVRAGISDPTRSPASGHLPVKAETLKDVGVEPPGIERRPSLFERIFRRRTADQ
ncbi:hypothetical protein ACMD2_21097 [Ananas comosus]|uniref:Uncharacterized protein n=2 Tax=Ananas comosus TaxID=4615 RepID=A0A199W0P0_ANACO|nr:hypothetical protein ACMD2_21097 [Ananas comosus]CAD1833870.1 unnamed protein product [Ananas comosus var. bracteatus]